MKVINYGLTKNPTGFENLWGLDFLSLTLINTQIDSFLAIYPAKALAPPTISRISLVMAA